MNATDLAQIVAAPQSGEGNRLRVLLVAHDAGLFGAQRTLLTLLQGIDSSAFVCHVVAPEGGPFVEAARKLGHTVHIKRMVRWVPAVRQLSRVGRWRYTRECVVGVRERAWAIASLLQRHQIDVVCTNTVTCIEGALAARMAALPHLWYIHEPISGNPELGALFPNLVYQMVVKALSQRVVFASRSLAGAYKAARASLGDVLYSGLPAPASRDRGRARATLLERLQLQPGVRLVGVVAALQPRKDHPTFLSAARRVAAARNDVHFVIVGSGDAGYTEEIRQQVRELDLGKCVHLVGWWPGEIQELMAGLDLLVIPSIQESFGLTAVEALAVGTPVVSTRCGGPAEIIRDGVDGVFVPVGDPEAMAQAMVAELADPAAAQARARTGRERVMREFTAERFVANMEALLREAAARKA